MLQVSHHLMKNITHSLSLSPCLALQSLMDLGLFILTHGGFLIYLDFGGTIWMSDQPIARIAQHTKVPWVRFELGHRAIKARTLDHMTIVTGMKNIYNAKVNLAILVTWKAIVNYRMKVLFYKKCTLYILWFLYSAPVVSILRSNSETHAT